MTKTKRKIDWKGMLIGIVAFLLVLRLLMFIGAPRPDHNQVPVSFLQRDMAGNLNCPNSTVSGGFEYNHDGPSPLYHVECANGNNVDIAKDGNP